MKKGQAIRNKSCQAHCIEKDQKAFTVKENIRKERKINKLIKKKINQIRLIKKSIKKKRKRKRVLKRKERKKIKRKEK